MNIQIDKIFLHKLAAGKASEEEITLFNNWLDTLNTTEQQEFMDDYQIIFLMYASGDDPNVKVWEEIERNIALHEDNKAQTKPAKLKFWIVAAASVFLAVALSIIFISKETKNSPIDAQKVQQQTTQDIPPGSNKATLKLADGSSVTLEDTSTEKIVLQSGLFVTKTKDGQLIYETNGQNLLGAVTYNTIETPKGGQYQVVLPDGTKVWLNASSSLRFPIAFGGKERRVELSGEGYFEVTKNVQAPFIVTTEREVVHVLGTHFNVSSYKNDEYSRTTLVEGKVEVSLPGNPHGAHSRILKPGQQSIINSKKIEVISTDVNESLAWKNGEFMFANEDIESVMKKIARWYDVEIIYPASLKRTVIWGSVSRFKNISEVLKVIQLTGSVHFKVEGRKVYVMN